MIGNQGGDEHARHQANAADGSQADGQASRP